MARVTSAKRYAQAAFELALARNELESWRESLENIAKLTKNEELMALLENPKFSFAAKKSLLPELLGEINPLSFNLALLLVSRGILRLAGNISQQYNFLLDAHRGIEHAEVIAALPLGDEDKELISRRLEEMVGHKVIIDAQVDPSIIGGFIARIGDTLIDGSVHHRLEALRESLVKAGR